LKLHAHELLFQEVRKFVLRNKISLIRKTQKKVILKRKKELHSYIVIYFFSDDENFRFNQKALIGNVYSNSLKRESNKHSALSLRAKSDLSPCEYKQEDDFGWFKI